MLLSLITTLTLVVCTTCRTSVATGFVSFTPNDTNPTIQTVSIEHVKDPLTTWSLVGIENLTSSNSFDMEFVIKLNFTVGIDQDILEFTLTSTVVPA